MSDVGFKNMVLKPLIGFKNMYNYNEAEKENAVFKFDLSEC